MTKNLQLNIENVVNVKICIVWKFHDDYNKGLELDEKIVYERKSNEFLYKNSSVEFILHRSQEQGLPLFQTPSLAWNAAAGIMVGCHVISHN